MANSMGVHMASFCLLSVVSALYSKTNESTADTRGQSQVHCTRQGSTADAKEPLALYF
jgi:Zn-dependent protease with chaperone function